MDGDGLFKTTGVDALKVADVGPVSSLFPLEDRALFLAGLDADLRLYMTDGETYERFSNSLPLFGTTTVIGDDLFLDSRVDIADATSFSLFRTGQNDFVEVAANVLETKPFLIGGEMFFGGYTEQGVVLFKRSNGSVESLGVITDDLSKPSMHDFLEFGDYQYFTLTGNGKTQLFRVSSVPEPNSLLVFLLGAVLIFCGPWRRGIES